MIVYFEMLAVSADESGKAVVMIDECHASGFLGENGRGTPEVFGVMERIDVITSTLGKTLSGQPVEYVLLRLTARQAGKREATLMFDVGQGTQDLGFRNEVPILFTVRPPKR